MLRGELWAGMTWVLQTAISVPSSTVKRYQTQKRIVRCHDHRYFWFHCHILNEQNFWLYKDQIKKKDKSTLQLERLWHWFGGTKALHTESQKSNFYTIAFAVFTFQVFSTVIPCLNIEVSFRNSFDRPEKIYCLSLKDLWETKSRQWQTGPLKC